MRKRRKKPWWVSKRLTEAQQEEVREMIRKGKPNYVVAERFGCSEKTVVRIKTRMKRAAPAVLVYSLALSLFSWACTSQEQFYAAAASARVEVGAGDYSEDRVGKRSWDGDISWVAFSLAPLHYWEMKMQAEMNARAILEQRYSERPPPEPEPVQDGMPAPSETHKCK